MVHIGCAAVLPLPIEWLGGEIGLCTVPVAMLRQLAVGAAARPRPALGPPRLQREPAGRAGLRDAGGHGPGCRPRPAGRARPVGSVAGRRLARR
ncbi:hypothetical protein KCH_62740 [Kitasatospora cheerisanensis KCTC 2395]|uniref:Uncharacterized protein n=1 Tax=Kitasatospora cheerisanensis KCTC 2395 TaxID=1348663 RepID=A0A066YLA0_9ACTN|nr:hypothetical protein KCH_62740 [Kitasatospora cheerisanensis KCTC 2395]